MKNTGFTIVEFLAASVIVVVLVIGFLLLVGAGCYTCAGMHQLAEDEPRAL